MTYVLLKGLARAEVHGKSIQQGRNDFNEKHKTADRIDEDVD
jgi:hypothetical protein